MIIKYLIQILGVPLKIASPDSYRDRQFRVGLSVLAFLNWAEKAQFKKSSTQIPHAAVR